MRNLLLTVISTFMVSSCCTTGRIIQNPEQLKIKVDIKEIHCWINQMPGIRHPSVHLSANLMIDNNEKHVLENFRMERIEIHSDSFIVNLNDSGIKADKAIGSGRRIEFNINASGEVKNPNIGEAVKAYFHFISGSKMYKFEINNLPVERVY